MVPLSDGGSAQVVGPAHTVGGLGGCITAQAGEEGSGAGSVREGAESTDGVVRPRAQTRYHMIGVDADPLQLVHQRS